MVPEMYPLLRLFTLGSFRIERLVSREQGRYEPVREQEWQSRGKAQTLLKVLLCTPHRQATRDQLIDLLWSENEQIQMKNPKDSLKSVLNVLRTILGGAEGTNVLLTIGRSEGPSYKLADQSVLWIDIDEFEALIKRASKATTQDQALPLWEQAYALLQGPFLPDHRYAEWANTKRAIFEGKRGQCVSALADIYLAQQHFDQAQEILWTAATASPVDEDALWRLLLLLEQREHSSAAWQLYKQAREQAKKDERSLTPRINAVAKRIKEKLESQEVPAIKSIIQALSPQSPQIFPSPLLRSEQVNDFILFLEKSSNRSFSVSKRKALQQIATILGQTTTGLYNIANFELWEILSSLYDKSPLPDNIDIDLVDNYIEVLKMLLTKGEAQYVMQASQTLYHKLMQQHSLLNDTRLAQMQLRTGMILGAAQEYTLPWYRRTYTVLQTYNHIEDNIISKLHENASLQHEHTRLLAKRGRQHRVLWQFEECEKACKTGISGLKNSKEDFPLLTHFLCEQAHTEATRGDEATWLSKLEHARREILEMPTIEREKALNQVDYMQGEGYKRFAFHTIKEIPMSLREQYAKYALEQFSQWQGSTIELPGFEELVVQVSKAQCLILIDPDGAIHLAGQLRKNVERLYPTLLDKISKVSFLAQKRLQMDSKSFLYVFEEASQSAYAEGRNIL